MKRKPLRAWCLVDTDGRLSLGFVVRRRRDLAYFLGQIEKAMDFAKHPKRRIVRVEVREVGPRRRP